VNADIFAEWLRRQGRRVVHTPCSHWYAAGPLVFQAFPYHWLIQPSAKELRALMLRHGIAALRYSTPLNAPQGMVSYHVVLRGHYNLETLRAQARNGVRRGLCRFLVERISFERLAEEGWSLQASTLERQGRTRSMNQAEWQRICRAADDLPGFEAWGATCDGELAAALIVARIDDRCYVPYALSLSRFLHEHVNNALFFEVSRDMLSRSGIDEIFFGLHSLDAPETVDEFKFRMSLMAKPVRQRVVLHPCLQPFATRGTHALLLRLLARDPGNPVLAKAEGMLRFHLEGKQPLQTQHWPACLSEYRARLTAIPAPDTEDAASRHESRTCEALNVSVNAAGGARHDAA
jgi:hypothetical protein